MFTIMLGAALAGAITASVPIGIVFARKRPRGWPWVLVVFILLACGSQVISYGASLGNRGEGMGNVVAVLLNETRPTRIIFNLFCIWVAVAVMSEDEPRKTEGKAPDK